MKAHTALLIATLAAPSGILDKERLPDDYELAYPGASEKPSWKSFYITALCQDLVDDKLKACNASCAAQNRKSQFDPGFCGIHASCKCKCK